MDKFSFISTSINQLFTNSGLREYSIFLLSCFGIAIIYNVVAGWVKNKWHY